MEKIVKFGKNVENSEKVGKVGKVEEKVKSWKVGNIIGCQLTQKVTKYTHL